MSFFALVFLTHLFPIQSQCDNERCSAEWASCSGVQMPELYNCLRREASSCCEEFLGSWAVEECSDDSSLCIQWREVNKLCEQQDIKLLSTIINLCPYSCGICLPLETTDYPSQPSDSLTPLNTLHPSLSPSYTPDSNVEKVQNELVSESFVPREAAIFTTIMVVLAVIICCMANGFLHDPCGCGESFDCFGNYSPPLRPVTAPRGSKAARAPLFEPVNPEDKAGCCSCFSNTPPQPEFSKQRGRKIKLPQKSSRAKVNHQLQLENTSLRRVYDK